MKPLRILVSMLVWISIAFTQEPDNSYFICAGRGGSPGEWMLRYVFEAGIEWPLDHGFSISSSLNYLEYPFYNYGGNSRVISHGSKSEIAASALVKLEAPWTLAPYIAGGVGIAKLREGEAILQSMTGTYWTTPSRDGAALFASVKTGFELFIFKKLAIGAFLELRIGTDLYSDNMSSQASVRFWP